MHSTETPGWAVTLGTVVILLGILVTVWHANEWMTFTVVGHPPYTLATMPEPDCDQDELAEEGLTLAECHQLATIVHSISISSPDWFISFHKTVSAAATLVAMLSIIVGVALVDFRPWASKAAIVACGTLAGLDIVSFIGVINTGPVVRQMYLWTVLLWFFIHLILTLLAAAGHQGRHIELHQASIEIKNKMTPTGGYSRFAVVLHWFIALSIFFLFISSWWMLSLPLASADFRFREFPFQFHKNLGITLVAAIFILLYLRFRFRPRPSLDQLLRSGMSKLAKLDHILLYVLILACCISGYMSSSYSGWGTTLWWTIDLPYWGHENEQLNQFWSDIHLWTCWLLLALVAVHISGALYHALRNDGIVRRMLHL